MARLFLSFSF